MHNFAFAQILLAVSVFVNAAFAKAVEVPGPAVVVRQTTPAQPTIMSCGEYSRIANLSTVGANSTYRATFFEASPNGNQFNAEVLDTAMAKLPSVIMDRALNEACGNLTALALQEAANNFTIRTVLQFANIPPTEPLDTSIHIIIVCVAAVTFMGGTWLAMP
ncbi:metal tolerance protein 3 protein [Colletotrichum tofieldiae]|uniref:Metal tolerance protein 3 protein n=1 Tax=Colletotrichum tofieldiae TaxID=708197 RepID=A0A161VNF2_9PEZI|nr:metal tolerance protein 3 protein [Colletotrichum tofieldiae]GKT56585.1 metal tolerance protein 3 protein [Colletotrichum tofieldiae]GKT76446.1 metal tolerance protein 3 protein [Colletotrichum tofieldiae]GKT87492.1 metal tolerance protein 3 protein [Colletotrichum tofieldiae]